MTTDQNNAGRTAIVLGATGLTGDLLLRELLQDPDYTQIIVFTRRPTGYRDPKLVEKIIDLFELQDHTSDFKGTVVFCCIGTTAKKTPDKSRYHKIDFGIPVNAARLCQAQEIPTLIIISSIGADPDSRVFYSRTKGEMEQEVLKCKIKNTYLLQPSFILGERKEKRPLESLGIVLTRMINPFLIGSLKKYRGIKASTIAKAMIVLDKKGYNKSIVNSFEIQQLGSV